MESPMEMAPCYTPMATSIGENGSVESKKGGGYKLISSWGRSTRVSGKITNPMAMANCCTPTIPISMANLETE